MRRLLPTVQRRGSDTGPQVLKRVQVYRFQRVPADYYDRTLEARRAILGAPSVSHLCKTIALCNKEMSTTSPPVDADSPLNSRYLLVVVPYDRRFDVERLRNHVVEQSKAAGRPVSRSRLNYRLADDCEALTGFAHGGVTPVGAKLELPVVLDARIAKLPLFWLGAGDVDLKLALRTADFVRAFSPFVVDLTD